MDYATSGSCAAGAGVDVAGAAVPKREKEENRRRGQGRALAADDLFPVTAWAQRARRMRRSSWVRCGLLRADEDEDGED